MDGLRRGGDCRAPEIEGLTLTLTLTLTLIRAPEIEGLTLTLTLTLIRAPEIEGYYPCRPLASPNTADTGPVERGAKRA